MQLHFPDYFLTDLLSTVAFGLVAIFLVVLGYKIFDKLTAKLDFDDLLMKGNVAMAIVIGSFIIGLCHVVAQVVSAIVRG
jgi:putative membrane protein